MADVGISVGIIPDVSGARVIKTSLDEITKQSTKADIAAQKLATSQMRLVASNTAAQAAQARSVASLKAAENAMRAAEIQAAKLDNAQDKLNQNANKSAGIFGNLKGLIAGYIGVQTIINTIKLADQYTLMNARLLNIAGSTREADRMMQQLRNTSNQTGTEIGTSLNILQRLSFVRKEINATNDDMLNFTTSVTQLGVISGASLDAQKFGLTQLGQALSSQYTRAEEFNSIMENIPAIGVKIAEGLGVSTGQLRQLVVQGKLLSSDVFAVLLNQSEEINRQFEQMPMTAAKGLQMLKNDLGEIVDRMNSASGGASVLGRMLSGLGEISKVLYVGLTSAFEYLVAIVLEAQNGVSKLFNLSSRGAAAIQNLNPFGPKVIPRQMPVVDMGTLLGAANDRALSRTRDMNAFGDIASNPTSAQRPISQDYASIAAGLSTKDKAGEAAAKKAATEAKRQQQELKSAIEGSRTQMERLNDEIAHLESLKGVAKTSREVELLNRGIQNTQAEIEKLRVQGELDSPLVKTFKDVADEIQDGFKDAFKSAFEGGGSAFGNFVEGVKKSFKSLLLDLAYQAAVKPILVNIIGSVGSSLGISGGALSSVLGTAGGAGGSAAGGFSGLGSLGSIGSSLLSGGLYSNTLGGIGNGIGNFLAGNGYNFIGPAAPGSLASIGAGALGNMGYGAIGSLGANLLGLGGGVGGTIGGTLGTLAGGAIGTSMGTILGFAGGPVGAIAGGFLGSALGGLFGGKSTPSGYVQTQVGAKDGRYYASSNSSDETSQAAIDGYKGLQDAAVASLNSILDAMGATLKKAPTLQFSSSNKRDGGKIRVGISGYGDDRIGYGINDMRTQEAFAATEGEKAANYAVLTTLKQSEFSGVADNLKGYYKTAFEKGKTLDDVLASIDLIKTVMIAVKTPAELVAESVTEINKAYDAQIKKAAELGLPMDKVTQVYGKQRDAAVSLVKSLQAGFNSVEDMTRAFDDFFNSQALSDTSSLTPAQKLQAAQSNFGALLAKAQGGDLSVTQDLLASARTLINQGRDVYASSVDYSNLEGFVRSSVKGIANQAGYTGQDVSYSIVSTNAQLVQVGTNTNTQIEAMKAEIFRLSNMLQAYVQAVA